MKYKFKLRKTVIIMFFGKFLLMGKFLAKSGLNWTKSLIK